MIKVMFVNEFSLIFTLKKERLNNKEYKKNEV